MLLMCIDPGIAATGLVLYQTEPERILSAETIRTKGGSDFGSVLSRAEEVTKELISLQKLKDPEYVVVESYEDFGSHLREAKLRWTTPLLLGMIHFVFPVGLMWIRPGEKSALKGLTELWKQGMTGACRGDTLLGNDHERDAAILGFLAWAKLR